MQYEVYVKGSINFIHSTKGSKKEFLKPHSHKWEVEVWLKTDSIENGISIDFVYAKNLLNEVLSQLEGRYLNSLSYFNNKNPTAENIALFVYRELNKKFVYRESNKNLISKVKVGDKNYGIYIYIHP